MIENSILAKKDQEVSQTSSPEDSYPLTLQDLRQKWANGEKFEIMLFYGHAPPRNGVNGSCLSQFYLAPFVIDSIQYFAAEQWMMAEKARLFNDKDMLDEILLCQAPLQAKKLGRKIRGFDEEVWVQNRFEIVRKGNFAKFSQNPSLRDFLLSTGTTRDTNAKSILAEASPRDRIWGIGLGNKNPKAQNPMSWRGRNILGFVLVAVRQELLQLAENTTQ